MPLLTYALRGARIVRIGEVARGLACACRCPACGEALIARKGTRKVHHFAHYGGADCGYGLETALHYRAKYVLARARRLKVPAVRLPHLPKPLFPAAYVPIDQVWVERRHGLVVPDLIVRCGRRRLLLEIAVTHPADARKVERLRRLGYAALEVNAAELAASVANQPAGAFDERAFSERLLHGVQHKRWLFNPRRNAVELQLRRRAARRPVRHARSGDRHFYTVRPCPQNKRAWHNAFQGSQPYADVFQDCLHCPYCLEIRYRTAYRAFREVPTTPQTVLCWGAEALEVGNGKWESGNGK